MYKDILLPVDLNHERSWTRSLPVALDLCRTFDTRLHVVSVIPEFGPSMVSQFFPEDFEKRATSHIMDALHAFVREHVPSGIRVQHVVAHGEVYDEIIRAAEANGCDLIVLGAHRPEFKDYLIGSNAARIVRHARCSVLVVRE